nr:MAG TPA: hypothetical protein [Caudoviricetes sp.]
MCEIYEGSLRRSHGPLRESMWFYMMMTLLSLSVGWCGDHYEAL